MSCGRARNLPSVHAVFGEIDAVEQVAAFLKFCRVDDPRERRRRSVSRDSVVLVPCCPRVCCSVPDGAAGWSTQGRCLTRSSQPRAPRQTAPSCYGRATKSSRHSWRLTLCATLLSLSGFPLRPVADKELLRLLRSCSRESLLRTARTGCRSPPTTSSST